MSDETRRSRRDKAADASGDGADGMPPKRELEEAPQLLRKASLILICGAILPWMTSISTLGHMPWGMWAGAVAVTLLAGYVMMESVKARVGLPANGLVKSVAGANPMAGNILALVLFIVACVLCWMGNAYFLEDAGKFALGSDGQPVYIGQALDGVGEDAGFRETYSIRGLLELGTLLLALATFAHILSYEYGGKFNPLFPLMFLGPAVAGSLHVFTAITQQYDNSLKIVGILGSLIVGAAGILAMYTMYVTMKQAKIEGDIKAAATRERRKQERASRRDS